MSFNPKIDRLLSVVDPELNKFQDEVKRVLRKDPYFPGLSINLQEEIYSLLDAAFDTIHDVIEKTDDPEGLLLKMKNNIIEAIKPTLSLATVNQISNELHILSEKVLERYFRVKKNASEVYFPRNFLHTENNYLLSFLPKLESDFASIFKPGTGDLENKKNTFRDLLAVLKEQFISEDGKPVKKVELKSVIDRFTSGVKDILYQDPHDNDNLKFKSDVENDLAESFLSEIDTMVGILTSKYSLTESKDFASYKAKTTMDLSNDKESIEFYNRLCVIRAKLRIAIIADHVLGTKINVKTRDAVLETIDIQFSDLFHNINDVEMLSGFIERLDSDIRSLFMVGGDTQVEKSSYIPAPKTTHSVDAILKRASELVDQRADYILKHSDGGFTDSENIVQNKITNWFEYYKKEIMKISSRINNLLGKAFTIPNPLLLETVEKELNRLFLDLETLLKEPEVDMSDIRAKINTIINDVFKIDNRTQKTSLDFNDKIVLEIRKEFLKLISVFSRKRSDPTTTLH